MKFIDSLGQSPRNPHSGIRSQSSLFINDFTKRINAPFKQGLRHAGKWEIPRNRKNLLEKNGVISASYIFRTNFPKIIIIPFSIEFSSNFSQNFTRILVFRPNERKIKPWFLKFSEKYDTIMHFRNFLKKPFGKFLNISKNLYFSSKRMKN